MRLHFSPFLHSVHANWHRRIWRALRSPLYGALAALWLAGCSTVPMAPSADQRPTLQLSPHSLPEAFEVVQRMQVQRNGQVRSFDALLEADQQQLQLAILQLSQTIAVLQWDGQQLQTRLAPGWPKVIEPEKLLSDLQYVWWPYPAVAAAMPVGWQLTEANGKREVVHLGVSVLGIQAQRLGADSARIELSDPVAAYTVTLSVQGAVPSFAMDAARAEGAADQAAVEVKP